MADRRDIVSVYPLTPVQQGMLFHTLYDPEGGLYRDQLRCTIVSDHEVDIDALRRACQRVVERHAALRTAFVWERQGDPVQVVLREARLPFDSEDWRSLSDRDRAYRLEETLRTRRERALALNRPPLLDVLTVRTGEREQLLVLDYHHMVMDAWSVSIVLRELLALYGSARRGSAPALDDAPELGGYTAWLGRQDRDRDERFWRGWLEGLEEPTPLAVLEEAKDGEGDGGPRQRQIRLPAEATERLQGFARGERLTLNTAIQGAWALLLSRYSGSPDVLYGMVVSGRPQEVPRVGGMVGSFINTLPVRVEVSPEARVSPWLQAVQRRLVELRKFEHSALTDVKGWSGIRAEAALFDTIVAFENTPLGGLDASERVGLRIASAHYRTRTNFPITVAVTPGERLTLQIRYDAGRIGDAAVLRMLEHYGRLLQDLAQRGGDARLEDLGFLSRAERHQLRWEWGSGAPAIEPSAAIHPAIETAGQRGPEAVAVVCGACHLTYGELLRRSRKLSGRLRTLEVGPEDRVGVCLERSPDLPVALLGILMAGGAYLTLDPGDPAHRLREIVADGAAAVVITGPSGAGVGSGLVDGGRRLELEPGWWRGAEGSAEPADGPLPAQLAYLLYTSGSTGRPKGVAVSHGAISHFLDWAERDLGLDAGDRMVQKTSLGFDASILEMFSPLRRGGVVVLASQGVYRDVGRLAELIERERVSVLQMVPSMFAALVEEPAFGRCTSLRLVAFGGETLARDLVEKLRRRLPVEIFNKYGPTEASVDATFHVLDRNRSGDRVPIGRPIAGMEALVVDRGGWLVPTGVVGELRLAGPGLARGYRGLAAETARRFLPHPDPQEPGERLYRTGDLCLLRPDGNLDFLGRLDRQVKVRGVRVELAEIEAAIGRHPGVVEAAVSLRTVRREPELVAHVVFRDGERPAAAELREFLGERLPPTVIPSLFEPIDEVPRMPSGKLDRGRLPAIAELRAPEPGEPTVRSQTAELMAGLWEDLFQVAGVGDHQTFFELGGHSLLATRLVSKIRRTFGVDLELRALFEAPTVTGLAERVDRLLVRGGDPEVPPIRPVPRDGVGLPLSFAQQRLWFMSRLQPGRAVYNVPVALRVGGALSHRALERSFGAIVERHEVLRTRYEQTDGHPVQRIDEIGRWSLPLVDLSGLPEAEAVAIARVWAGEAAARPFALDRSPMLRTLLLRLAPRDHVVVLTVHHIAADGWSMEVLTREMERFYRAFEAGEEPDLPPLAVQYGDFSVWQRRWMRGEVLDGELAYWREKLRGAPRTVDLPTDRPRPRAPSFAGDRLSFELSPELTTEMEALCRRRGVTPFMALLAAFFVLLHRSTGQADLVVGTDLANRGRHETEGLIGFFINVLPVRCDLSGAPTFLQVLDRVREVALETYAHQDVPFDRLVAELRPERSLGGSPLFNLLFVMQGGPRVGGPPGKHGLRLTSFGLGQTVSRFDLALFFRRGERSYQGACDYQTEIFDQRTVSSFCARYRSLLERLVGDPGARVDQVDHHTDEERRARAVDREVRKMKSFKKFKRVQPKAVDDLERELVRFRKAAPDSSLPVVCEPAAKGVDLIEWTTDNREPLERRLLDSGAVLFRGFDVSSVPEFERFALAACPDLYGGYGDLPKEDQGEKTYKSTPYPPDKTILFHNESSHTPRWPMRQFFYSVEVAEEGGETPIVDCRALYRHLDPEIRDQFESKGLLYVRNFSGLDVSWQDFFGTQDRREVEARCREDGVACEWLGDDELRIRQRGPGVATHPQTGEKVFFNQVQLHHAACLDEATRESMAAVFADDRLPRNVFFGDGSPIPDETIERILDLYWALSVAAPWQQGDILMVDNMLVAHARNPFRGARKIVVAMGRMFDRQQVMA